MTDFCTLIYIKTSEDLPCADPNVYRENWKVKSFLSDSYSKTSVSHNPLFRSVMMQMLVSRSQVDASTLSSHLFHLHPIWDNLNPTAFFSTAILLEK